MNDLVTFVLDGNLVKPRFGPTTGLTPTTTVLNYLRSLPDHRGAKEGCAEGDCGACTVVIGELSDNQKIKYRSVDSCLMFLPMLHGKQLVTVENLGGSNGQLHPVQQAMVDSHGSQCGFCTPGIVMSLLALSKNTPHPTSEEAKVALAGNLCRCTGYRPIIDAAIEGSKNDGNDQLFIHEKLTLDLLSSIPHESISIVIPEQRYDQPVSLREALALVKEYPTASIINGATDVALRVTKEFETLPHVIDLSRIPELMRVSKDGNTVTVGAGVRINDLMKLVRQDFPALYEMLSVFGADQIRNVATLGGNIGTASPIGDILPVLIAYNAKIELDGTKGRRTVNADKFVTGYRTTERGPDEIITGIVLPIPSKKLKVRSYKVSRRKDLDISTVSSGFSIEVDSKGIVDNVVLAYGGMAERTRRAELTENFIKGKPWMRTVVEDAQALIDKEFSPISDVRGSMEFRKIVARNLLLKFWNDTK